MQFGPISFFILLFQHKSDHISQHKTSYKRDKVRRCIAFCVLFCSLHVSSHLCALCSYIWGTVFYPPRPPKNIFAHGTGAGVRWGRGVGSGREQEGQGGLRPWRRWEGAQEMRKGAVSPCVPRVRDRVVVGGMWAGQWEGLSLHGTWSHIKFGGCERPGGGAEARELEPIGGTVFSP